MWKPRTHGEGSSCDAREGSHFHGHHVLAGAYLRNLGEIQLQAGHPAQARKSFERAIEISTAPDEWQVHMDALLNLAKMQNQAGQIADADAGFRQALEIAGKLDFPRVKATPGKCDRTPC